MSNAIPLLGLIGLVTAILLAHRRPTFQHVFRWLPVPLWCYLLPAVFTSLGWLPSRPTTYRAITDGLLPFALVLLLLNTDLGSLRRIGGQALIAAGTGALGVIIGAALGVCLLQRWLPPEAWKGAGALAGTWTGGTMNLLALRALLNAPDAVFAPLILVDAMIAYGWMAFLVAVSGMRDRMNAWLRAPSIADADGPASAHGMDARSSPLMAIWRAATLCVLLAAGIAVASRALAWHLPLTRVVNSASGWTVLLVSTETLGLALLPAIRRLGAAGPVVGYPCLYVVLAATGAQASLEALRTTPIWIVLGLIIVCLHGTLLLLAGRWQRIPIELLATASQANIGGVVSAPLVAAIYTQRLAPIGLLLAIAFNAIGTYLGWSSAMLARALTHA